MSCFLGGGDRSTNALHGLLSNLVHTSAVMNGLSNRQYLGVNSYRAEDTERTLPPEECFR
jgi:hypothetical protein